MKWLWLILFISCGAQKNEDRVLGPTPTKPDLSLCEKPATLPIMTREEDFLSFANFGYRGIGRCRAHAVLTQKLLLLMRFNPEASFICEADCLSMVRGWLSDVEEGKVVTVPGFKNLAEFSAHPEIQPLLRDLIISYGSRYSATSVPLPGSARSVSVFHEVLRRVKKNQVPYVAINGAFVGNHGVLGYAVKTLNGQQVLCVRDPNIVPEVQEQCENFMWQQGEDIIYERSQRPQDVIQLDLKSDEDARVRTYLKALCR